MSELIKSIEKSVAFLKDRYPDNLPLLVSLEGKLKYLYAKQDTKNNPKPVQEDKSE